MRIVRKWLPSLLNRGFMIDAEGWRIWGVSNGGQYVRIVMIVEF